MNVGNYVVEHCFAVGNQNTRITTLIKLGIPKAPISKGTKLILHLCASGRTN